MMVHVAHHEPINIDPQFEFIETKNGKCMGHLSTEPDAGVLVLHNEAKFRN